MFIKWYSMKKKIIEYPRFSQYSALCGGEGGNVGYAHVL